MDWNVHLLLAEAARLGVRLVCEHVAAAPLAADVAGGFLRAGGGWQVAGYPDGFRSVRQIADPADLQPGELIAVVGPAVPTFPRAPDLWLDPPADVAMAPLSPAFPRLVAAPGLPNDLRVALCRFADNLKTGEADTWDCLERNLVGGPFLRSANWASPGFVSCEIDPLATVLVPGRAEAIRLAAEGEVRICAQRAVVLRLPLLGAAAASMELTIGSAGLVDVCASQSGVAVEVVRSTDPRGWCVTLVPDFPLPWIDLTITARAAVLDKVSICLATDAAGEHQAPDTLDRYGDPLDAFATPVVP